MQKKAIVDVYKPCSYDGLRDDCARLCVAYPGIVSVKTVGYSVEKRRLLLLALGKGEKKVLLCGAHHGREYLTSGFLMRMAEHYAARYAARARETAVFDRVGLHILPMVNPDGVEISRQGFPGEAALFAGDPRAWKANRNGIDLNRQYPCLWEQSAGADRPGPAGYKGARPASEPEVRAVMRLCAQNDYRAAASFHTKGEEVYYADSHTGILPRALRMAQKIAGVTGYVLMPVSSDRSVFAGGFENWFRQAFHRPALLVELTPYDGSPIPHDEIRFDDLVRDRARDIGLILAQEALSRLPR